MYTYYKLEVVNWHHDGTPDRLQPIEMLFEVKKLSDIFGERPRRERRLDESVITDMNGSVYSSSGNKEKREFVLVLK